MQQRVIRKKRKKLTYAYTPEHNNVCVHNLVQSWYTIQQRTVLDNLLIYPPDNHHAPILSVLEGRGECRDEICIYMRLKPLNGAIFI